MRREDWFRAALFAMLLYAVMHMLIRAMVGRDGLGISSELAMWGVFLFAEITFLINARRKKLGMSLRRNQVVPLVLAVFFCWSANWLAPMAMASAPNPGYALAVSGTQALWIGLCSWLFLGRPVTRFGGMGMVCSAVGLIFLFLSAEYPAQGEVAQSLASVGIIREILGQLPYLWFLVSLVATALWVCETLSFQVLISRAGTAPSAARNESLLVYVFGGVLLVLTLLLLLTGGFAQLSLPALLLMLVAGVCSGVATTRFFEILESGMNGGYPEAVFALQSVLVVIASAVVFGSTLSAGAAGGVGLCLVGTAFLKLAPQAAPSVDSKVAASR